MNLELRSIVERGVIANERITLRAKSDADLGDFLLAQSGYADESVTTEIFRAFWFPYKPIGAGDLVVLYTKRGVPREKPLSTGKVAHFFYWGLESPIWNIADRAAVLLSAPNWASKAVMEF